MVQKPFIIQPGYHALQNELSTNSKNGITDAEEGRGGRACHHSDLLCKDIVARAWPQKLKALTDFVHPEGESWPADSER